ncbi:hypothetical protein Ancab_038167, partial [Ancistrocladus abbreviatus]
DVHIEAQLGALHQSISESLSVQPSTSRSYVLQPEMTFNLSSRSSIESLNQRRKK